MQKTLFSNVEADFPHLIFKKNWDINPAISSLLAECLTFIKAIRGTPIYPSKHFELLNVSFIKGAQATTAIEGNTLTTEEIRKVIKGQPISASREYQVIEVKNVLEALNTLLKEVVFDNDISLIDAHLIKRFHKLVGKNLGDHLDAIPGTFRKDNRFVGSYRCPDPYDIEFLVDRLTTWLYNEFHFTNNQTFPETVIQAIVTHIYLEWIHPFGDGNGRTGRLLEFYILIRGGLPDIASHILSNHYNKTRNEYYKHFDNARYKRNLTEFINYALEGFRDGLENTLQEVLQSQLEITWQKFIYDKFSEIGKSDKITMKRRRKLALSLKTDEEYTMDTITTTTSDIAREYAKLSERSLIRDLKELESLKLIKKKDRKFKANISLLQMQGYFPNIRGGLESP